MRRGLTACPPAAALPFRGLAAHDCALAVGECVGDPLVVAIARPVGKSGRVEERNTIAFVGCP